MSYTVAGTLHTDPRISEAKALLIEAVKEQQAKIKGIRPGDPKLKMHYNQALEKFGKLRGANLWYPYLGSGLGKGPFVELLDGSVKYDFICGIGVHYWGHSHPDIIAASIDAAISNMTIQGNLQQNGDSLDLAELFVKASGMDHCFFTTSGVMANENALKIAFQKNAPANRILTFEHTFSGRTYTFSQVSDKPLLRDGLPSNLCVDYLPFYDPKDPEGSTKRAVATLKKLLARYPKRYAMMIFELVQGEGGCYPGSHEFFKPILEILKEHHIAIVADEVQTFGRTPQLFAYQHFKLEEYIDIVTIGKVSQVCATLYRDEYNPRPGLVAQTFTSSTTAFHVSKVIVHGLIHDGFFGPDGKIKKIHDHFEHRLQEIAKRHPGLIEGPFGIGTMVAFTPFGGDAEKVKKFTYDLFDAGVMSFIAGESPTRVRFLLPIGAVTEKDVDAVCKIIEETLLKN